jgi:hypothetical protein
VNFEAPILIVYRKIQRMPELDFTEVQLDLILKPQSLCFNGGKTRRPGYLIIDQQNEKYTSKFVENAFEMQTIAAIPVRF